METSAPFRTPPQDVPQDIYKVLMEFSPICTVDIILFNPQKTHVLLGKRVNAPYQGLFYTFGGRLRKNETLEEAAVRVAKNEIGVTVTQSNVTFGGLDNEISDSSVISGTNYHAVALYFSGTIPENTPVELDAQHSEYQWIAVNDPIIHPSIQSRILNALRAVRA